MFINSLLIMNPIIRILIELTDKIDLFKTVTTNFKNKAKYY